MALDFHQTCDSSDLSRPLKQFGKEEGDDIKVCLNPAEIRLNSSFSAAQHSHKELTCVEDGPGRTSAREARGSSFIDLVG
jgi:hypothetical protein